MNEHCGEILVIGYGSKLRGDDAVGRVVAEFIANEGLPSVRALSVTQLMPELAAEIAQAQTVIFVDACFDATNREISVREVSSGLSASTGSHHSTPQQLLALCETCYQRGPRAWLVAVPAFDGHLTDTICADAAEQVAAAIRAVLVLVELTRECEVAYA